MSGCCVYNCTNRYSTNGLKFYRIPTGSRPFQKKRQRLWLQAIKRVDWSKYMIKNAHVCSAHFISGKFIYVIFSLMESMVYIIDCLYGVVYQCS